MDTALSYLRVSTKEQSDSLPVQQSKVLSYIQTQKLNHAQAFVDSQSGRTDDRPQLQALLQFCKKNKGKVQHVVVSDLSRLARNVVDQGKIIGDLTTLGIRLHSVDEQALSGDDAAGKLGRNVVGAFSQFFSDSLSERTKFRMEAAVKEGRFVWVAPCGYINEKNGRGSIIKVDPDRGPLVRRGFEYVSRGFSAEEALRKVSALGLTTRKGGPVPRQTWHKIMRNPLYAGWVKSGDNMVKGTHESLISQELFDKVQRTLESNGKGPALHQTMRPEFPLRRFVCCPKCDKGLTAGLAKGKFPYYWCWTKGCKTIFVPKDELEADFRRLLTMLEPTLVYLNQMPVVAARRWEARRDGLQQEVRILKGRLAEQRTLNSKNMKAKLQGQFSEEEFQAMKGEIAEETKKIEDALEALEIERKSLLEAAEQPKLENVHFVKSWDGADVVAKIELQKALFPDGLVWTHESGYLNSKNRWIVEDMSLIAQEFTRKPMSIDEFFVRFGVPDGI